MREPKLARRDQIVPACTGLNSFVCTETTVQLLSQAVNEAADTKELHMAGTIRKIAKTLLFRSQGNSKPYLESNFLKLLNALIQWRVSIEFAKREAEEKAIWAEAFADGTAMPTATSNEPLHPNQLT